MTLAPRHTWFFAAAGLASWLSVAGLQLIAYLGRSHAPGSLLPNPLSLTAFLVFIVVIAGSILDRSRKRASVLLTLEVLAMLGMAASGDSTLVFPLLVLVAWQAALVSGLPSGLAWVLGQTLALRLVLWREWGSLDCWVGFAVYFPFQLFAALAASVVRAEASHGQQLAQANAEMILARALVADAARAEERLRISRELHDAWGHELTALSLRLELASHEAEGAARESLTVARGLAGSLLNKVRDVVGALRIEDGCDIVPMLQALATGLPRPALHLKISAAARLQTGRCAQDLLRCVQEIVTNAQRHADARNLWLELSQEDGELRISARDDGRGAAVIAPGHGLVGMRERFEALGGHLEVESKSGAGFSLSGRLPLERAAA